MPVGTSVLAKFLTKIAQQVHINGKCKNYFWLKFGKLLYLTNLGSLNIIYNASSFSTFSTSGMDDIEKILNLIKTNFFPLRSLFKFCGFSLFGAEMVGITGVEQLLNNVKMTMLFLHH